MIFSIGRRTHRISKLTDLNDPVKFQYIEQMFAETGVTTENVDDIVGSIIKRFI